MNNKYAYDDPFMSDIWDENAGCGDNWEYVVRIEDYDVAHCGKDLDAAKAEEAKNADSMIYKVWYNIDGKICREESCYENDEYCDEACCEEDCQKDFIESYGEELTEAEIRPDGAVQMQIGDYDKNGEVKDSTKDYFKLDKYKNKLQDLDKRKNDARDKYMSKSSKSFVASEKARYLAMKDYLKSHVNGPINFPFADEDKPFWQSADYEWLRKWVNELEKYSRKVLSMKELGEMQEKVVDALNTFDASELTTDVRNSAHDFDKAKKSYKTLDNKINRITRANLNNNNYRGSLAGNDNFTEEYEEDCQKDFVEGYEDIDSIVYQDEGEDPVKHEEQLFFDVCSYLNSKDESEGYFDLSQRFFPEIANSHNEDKIIDVLYEKVDKLEDYFRTKFIYFSSSNDKRFLANGRMVKDRKATDLDERYKSIDVDVFYDEDNDEWIARVFPEGEYDKLNLYAPPAEERPGWVRPNDLPDHMKEESLTEAEIRPDGAVQMQIGDYDENGEVKDSAKYILNKDADDKELDDLRAERKAKDAVRDKVDHDYRAAKRKIFCNTVVQYCKDNNVDLPWDIADLAHNAHKYNDSWVWNEYAYHLQSFIYHLDPEQRAEIEAKIEEAEKNLDAAELGVAKDTAKQDYVNAYNKVVDKNNEIIKHQADNENDNDFGGRRAEDPDFADLEKEERRASKNDDDYNFDEDMSDEAFVEALGDALDANRYDDGEELVCDFDDYIPEEEYPEEELAYDESKIPEEEKTFNDYYEQLNEADDEIAKEYENALELKNNAERKLYLDRLIKFANENNVEFDKDILDNYDEVDDKILNLTELVCAKLNIEDPFDLYEIIDTSKGEIDKETKEIYNNACDKFYNSLKDHSAKDACDK